MHLQHFMNRVIRTHITLFPLCCFSQFIVLCVLCFVFFCTYSVLFYFGCILFYFCGVLFYVHDGLFYFRCVSIYFHCVLPYFPCILLFYFLVSFIVFLILLLLCFCCILLFARIFFVCSAFEPSGLPYPVVQLKKDGVSSQHKHNL